MNLVHHTCLHKVKNTPISFAKLYFPRKMFFDDSNDDDEDDDDFESLLRVRYSH